MISEETVERVLNSTDIVDLVQSYFPLRRAGTDYMALCPFHSEKTPSFTVSPSKQMFYCFGCGIGGGAARFLMERESIDFPTAIRRMGERAGIPIVEDRVSPEKAGKLKQRSKLLAVHHEATLWFHRNLTKQAGAEHARDYLKNRGLGIEMAREWQLGYAPGEAGAFFDWARSKKYDNSLLIDAGLAVEREGPAGRAVLVPRFRNRLMFPVCNDFGEVIAFSGRTLDPEAKVAKYLNSPETALFHKSKTLYGLHRSKRPILKAGRALICEGQIDLITAFAHGIEIMVAPLGTAFTDEHARLLKRVTQEAIICFDADSAGFKAAQRTFKVLAAANIFVRAIQMPAGEDPDSYIHRFGAKAFEQLIEKAEDFLEFHIAYRSTTGDLNSPRQQHELAEELAENIALVGDKLMQDTMINSVSGRLGLSHEEYRRRVFAVSKRQEQQRQRQDRWKKTEVEEPRRVFEFQDASARLLCQMMLIEPRAKAWFREEVRGYTEMGSIPDGELLVKVAEAPVDVGDSRRVAAYLGTLEEPLERRLAQLVMKPPDGDHLQAAKDAWKNLTQAVVKRRYRELEGQLKRGDLGPAAMMQLLGELKDLKEKLNH